MQGEQWECWKDKYSQLSCGRVWGRWSQAALGGAWGSDERLISFWEKTFHCECGQMLKQTPREAARYTSLQIIQSAAGAGCAWSRTSSQRPPEIPSNLILFNSR